MTGVTSTYLLSNSSQHNFVEMFTSPSIGKYSDPIITESESADV